MRMREKSISEKKIGKKRVEGPREALGTTEEHQERERERESE